MPQRSRIRISLSTRSRISRSANTATRGRPRRRSGGPSTGEPLATWPAAFNGSAVIVMSQATASRRPPRVGRVGSDGIPIRTRVQLREDVQRDALHLPHLVLHRPEEHALQAGRLVAPQEVDTRGR